MIRKGLEGFQVFIDKHWDAIFVTFMVTLILFISYATVYAEQIEPEAELTTTTLIVHWYDTEAELQEALGYEPYWNDTAGYSECEFRPDFNTSFCELWLVRPKEDDDGYAFDTIGHEVYHALAGDFHD